jgi:hypothetical protein
MGQGVIVSCLARMMHPRWLIENMFPNMNNNKRLAVCIVWHLKTKTICRKDKTCLVVQCDKVSDGDSHIEIYASTLYFKIHMEGPQEGFFVVEQFTGEAQDHKIQGLPDILNIGRTIDEDDIDAQKCYSNL